MTLKHHLQRIRTMAIIFQAVILLGICLASTALAYVTPARVQTISGNNGTTTLTGSIAVTLPATPTTGNTLIALISTRASSVGRVSGITSSGATWTRVVQVANANGSTIEVWYAPNVTGAANGTVTVGLNATNRAAAIVTEYSGLLTPTSLDLSTSNSGTGNSGSTANATTGTTAATSQAGELWLAGISFNDSNKTLGTLLNSFVSYSNTASGSGTGSLNTRLYALERFATATGTASSGGTISAVSGSTSYWTGAIATFKAAPTNATTVGTPTATAAGRTSIAVSMPYTNDDNANNTYTVQYKLSSDSSWTNWVVGAAHTASPYTTTITGLTPGTSYVVRCTYNDTDGVTGTNPPPDITVNTAIIEALDAWTNVSSTTPNVVSGTVNSSVTVSAGTNRLFLAAVCAEASNTPTTFAIGSVTLNSVPLVQVGQTLTTGRELCYLGYLKDGSIPGGAVTLAVPYSVTGTGITVSGLHVKWGSYQYVNQTNPLVTPNGSAANYNNNTTVTFGTAVNYVVNGMVLFTAANGGSPATFTPPATFTQIEGTTSNHSSFIATTPLSLSPAGNYSSGTTASFSINTSTRSAIVVASLNPAPAGKTDQTITVDQAAPANAAYGATFDVKAHASSGLDVAVTTDGACTGSGATNASTVVTITMSSGTGNCNVYFNQAGNDVYNAAPQQTNNTAANKVNQSISVDLAAPANASYSTNFDVKAHAASGLGVAVTTGGVCSGSGTSTGNPGSAVNITMTSGTGTCTVYFNQTGDTNYNAATQVVEDTGATKATQSITVTTSAPATAAYLSDFTVAAYSSSALAIAYSSGSPTICSNSGATFTMNAGSGTCKVQYDQVGNSNFDPAPQKVEDTAAQKATPTATVTNSPQTYDGSAKAATVTCTGGGAAGNLRYNTLSSAITAGSYAVLADCAASANYGAASNLDAGTFVISKATPTIAVSNSPVTYSGAAKTATINGSVPGNASSIKYDGASSAINAATYAVTANFTPTDTTNYTSLTAAGAGNFVIAKATPTLSVTNSPVTADGNPHAATVIGSVPGTPGNVSTGGSPTQTAAGTYAVTADFAPADSSNYNPLLAAPAGNFIILAPETVTVTLQTVPAGLLVSVDGGAAQVAPYTFTTTASQPHTIATTSPQGTIGTRYVWNTWSDHGAISHPITAPATGNATYTATFTTQYQLTTTVTPPGSGTVLPASGSWYNAGSSPSIIATAGSGYAFSSWSGPVANFASTATTVTMTGPATVTATMQALATTLNASVVRPTSGTFNGDRTWSIKLDNTGLNPATAAQITYVDLSYNTRGTCKPTVSTSFPLAVGDIPARSSSTAQITVNFAGCAKLDKFNVSIGYSANNGATSGVTNLTSQGQ